MPLQREFFLILYTNNFHQMKIKLKVMRFVKLMHCEQELPLLKSMLQHEYIVLRQNES